MIGSEKKDDGDKSEEEEDIVIFPVKTKWDEASSDDEEDKLNQITSSRVKEDNGSSIDILLDSVKSNPEYLQSYRKQEFVVPVIKKSMESTKLDKLFNPSIATDYSASKKQYIDNLTPSSSASMVSNITTSIKSQQSSKSAGKTVEKETAKDRVKRQRLSGQSGIGSDFREWRSEEEMRIRQQFD